MATEQDRNNKLIKTIKGYIDKATDVLEKQFVLEVSTIDLRKYILSMEQFGLFDKWWKEKELYKEAKKFLKDPNVKSISTYKQEVFGTLHGKTFTLFFNMRAPSEHYYKSIRKKKISYFINKAMVLYMRLEYFDSETKEDKIVFEQGFATRSDSPHTTRELIH